MEILGIGAPELVFIVIIALIVFGPKDMQKAGKTIGKWLRDTVTSDGWKLFQQTTRELRNLPTRLMRDANEDLNKVGEELNTAINPAEDRRSSYIPAVGEKSVASPTLTTSQPPIENDPVVSTPDTSETESQSNQETNV
ncbi:MAG: twin-arginine translocase TatA/TatE family subunit [Anaerolineales bacterium]|nr:twin-arginine translocase TatA/TatE family subunit [Anaerolineales bacterium]